MNYSLKIKKVLEVLDDNQYEYTFLGNKEDIIEGFSTLFNYQKMTMTFITKLYKFSDYAETFQKKGIQLIITDPSETISSRFNNVIQIEKPTNAFFKVLSELFNDDIRVDNPITNDYQVFNKHSFVSEQAKIGENVKIGIGCIIEPNVQIGDNTTIHHNVVIKSKTNIGKNCTIFSGTVIGERGFNPLTQEDNSRIMLKHYGGVRIKDNVHIGANCSINQGTIDDTVIKDGVKLNTMVHIAHNCVIGKNTVITTPAQISGSVEIGANCHVAATVVRNQCKVGDNAVLGLGSVVVRDVPAGMTVVGNPAKPLKK